MMQNPKYEKEYSNTFAFEIQDCTITVYLSIGLNSMHKKDLDLLVVLDLIHNTQN